MIAHTTKLLQENTNWKPPNWGVKQGWFKDEAGVKTALRKAQDLTKETLLRNAALNAKTNEDETNHDAGFFETDKKWQRLAHEGGKKEE